MGASAGTLLLVGGVLAGPLGTFAKSPSTVAPQSVQQQAPAYSGSVQVVQDQNGTGDTSAALQAQAKITAAQAQQAALSANPGTTVKQVSLDNENGSLVYSVELSNGTDVKVDAGTGKILATDAADSAEANQQPEAASESN